MAPTVLQQQKIIGEQIKTYLAKLQSKEIRQAQYIEIKKSVEKAWQTFQQNDTKIVKTSDEAKNYIETNYFDHIRKSFEIILELIDQSSSAGDQKLEERSNNTPANQLSNCIKELYQRKAEELQEQMDQIKISFETDSKIAMEYKKSRLEKRYDEMEKIYHQLMTENKFQIDYEVEHIRTCIENEFHNLVIELMNNLVKSKAEINIKLENIKIPQFYGDINEWSSFFDLFDTLVNKNGALKNVEKMYRLKSALKGNAAKLIQHLTVTEYNYEAALDILKQRFQNNRLLFAAVVDRLLDQPNMNSDYAASVKQLLDTTNECIHALEALNIKIEDAKPFFARIIIRKFDREALRQYEYNIKKIKEVQSLDDVLAFLEQMYQALDAVKLKKGASSNNSSKFYQRQNTLLTSVVVCAYCQIKGHKIKDCKKFLAMNSYNRRLWAQKAKICLNCLHHQIDRKCFNTTVKCNRCGKNHNTLLHFDMKTKSEAQQPTEEEQAGNSKKFQREAVTMATKEQQSDILLATAQIKVKNNFGEEVVLRALIDPGSQRSTITEETAQTLQLPRTKIRTELHGLGDVLVGVSKSKINLEISPRFKSISKFKVEALVLPMLTNQQPDNSFQYDLSKWDNYCLADPYFNKSDRIDIVIGSDLYYKIVEDKVRKLDKMLGQDTKLGWLISGIISRSSKTTKNLSAVTTSIEKFWEIEEIAEPTQNNCEEETVRFFEKTTQVDKNGRFVVKLPFEEDHQLGQSKKQALARFLSLERKLERNTELKRQYINFMEEYLQMGHMEEAKSDTGIYYLPHQAVMRENSITSKLRVVFDASAKTSNGRSLNDVLKVGPKLQKDIFDIIIKWRLWKYVVTADVEKMYRQILVNTEDRKYQHILWRDNKNAPMKEYELTTVTYGITSAPFLAKKVLQEVSKDCKHDAQIAEIIADDFYMDDLMTGADSERECIEMQLKLTQQLMKFGLPLRKWTSNSDVVMKEITNTVNLYAMTIDNEVPVKTLGIEWHPKQDLFMYNLSKIEASKLTKRNALSTLAKIYDPIGWLTPFITCIKLFIQELWLLKLKWDEVLNEELTKQWNVIINSLTKVKTISIPRWFNTTSTSKIEFYGFADASQKAYAAVVYIKIESSITLVAGKSKVNPIKNRKTLPKLELCAAHLLARLMDRILKTINREAKIYLWSDSTITLSWIKNNKSKDRFIKRKVEEIKALVPTADWRYVNTKSNPADAGSRGVNAEALQQLWWTGPSWIKKENTDWPVEIARQLVTTTELHEKWMEPLAQRFSSYKKLERVIAYVRRFIGKLKKNAYQNWLTTIELKEAAEVIIREHQREHFLKEINKIKNNIEVDTKSNILSLYPILDENCILRVGGRLANSKLSYQQKHPAILNKSWVAELIIKDTHALTLHGGNKLTESIVRRKYWIIGCKRLIKKVIRACVRCIRYRKHSLTQIMGNLPYMRVSISHPFTHTGVDYAGPIWMKCSKYRGQKAYKSYIAVFVCMATRAIHLEAVSDLTTDAFLAALKRFFARRGKAEHIYSDNGTNFVGAKKELDADLKKAIKNNLDAAEILEADKIQWHFMPPASPHFGGIWEAGVKSVKYHLRRIIGETKLTYEEMSTLLAQIEAVLNSRPLHAITNDLEDIDVLTPGHFLIGHPLLESQESYNEVSMTSLNRWKIIQKMKRDFWQRWKDEYLTTLQHRHKWQFAETDVLKNEVVILKDENSPPSRWSLGRIEELHPGVDGKIRVVTVKTKTGMFKRPISKVCPLAISEGSKIEKDEAKANLTTTRTSTTSKKPMPPHKVLLCLFWILITLSSHLVTTAAPLNSSILTKVVVQEIKQNTAIYLDDLGTLDTVGSTWNLIIHYNLVSYFNAIEEADKFIFKMQGICRTLSGFEDQCATEGSNLQSNLNKIRNTNKLLFRRQIDRSKRAPFEFVGSLYHILFGMMDSDDREEVQQNMQNLLDNQHDLKYLIKQQTSVVESTINILAKTTDEVKAHFEDLHIRMDNITVLIKENYYAFRESIRFFMITKQADRILLDVERVQMEIIELLIDINHGKINPDLIRPDQLQDEVRRIKEWLPEELKLPGNASNSLQIIYKLLKATGILLEDKLVINVKIPLLKGKSCQFYKIIPVPIIVNSEQVIADVELQVLVYNFDIDAYHLMSDLAVQQCNKISERHILCDSNLPWTDANDEACEISPLKPANQHHCVFKQRKNIPFWIKLNMKNRWLFKTFNKSSCHIICDKRQNRILELPAQGVFTLESGCTMRVGSTTVSAPYNIQTESDQEMRSILTKEVADIPIWSMKPLRSTIFNHTSEIEDIKNKLKFIKEENVNLKGLNFHNVNGHVSLIILLILIAVLLLFYYKNRTATVLFSVPQQTA